MTERISVPVFWSVECSRCLFSNSNQSPGKTPCRWKNNFHNNPSGSHWESSYIPWWHYVLRLFSSSAVTEKEAGDFHYHARATVLSAAARSSFNSRSSVSQSCSTSLRPASEMVIWQQYMHSPRETRESLFFPQLHVAASGKVEN